jgi:hypothetical protein
MASGRDRSGSFCFAIHASIADDWSGKTRRCTDSAPVGGRPIFFPVRDSIDLFMGFLYQKVKPRGSVYFRPGSNPQHEVNHVEG